MIAPAIIATVTGAIQAVYRLPIGEKSVGAIELRRDEIMRCEPMAKEETETLFLFASASQSRTAKSRDHWKQQLREAVELRDQTPVTDLKQWLPVASPDQIREELIRGITWETSAEAVEYVERAVSGKLATIGESRGVPPSVAKRVALRLLDEILKILRKKTDRFVDRLRFLELWEDETRVGVPQAEYEKLVSAVAAKASGGLGLTELFQNGAPPFAGILSQRCSLVDEIQEQLRSNGFVHLHGSTRMGKTTLAKLVVHRSEAQWLWWSATRQPGSDVARTLRTLTRELDAQSGPISVVLDDLDFTPTTIREFEQALGELIATVRGRRGSLLITGQKPIATEPRRKRQLIKEAIVACLSQSYCPIRDALAGTLQMFQARVLPPPGMNRRAKKC